MDFLTTGIFFFIIYLQLQQFLNWSNFGWVLSGPTNPVLGNLVGFLAGFWINLTPVSGNFLF